MNKAETLHFKDDSYFFTGAGQQFQVPSVIRLKYNIKKKGNPVYKVSRMGIFSRDNFTCQYCGSRKQNLTLDHVHPRHLGGKHTWDNLVTCCNRCNNSKGWKTLDESGMKLFDYVKPNCKVGTIVGLFGAYPKDIKVSGYRHRITDEERRILPYSGNPQWENDYELKYSIFNGTDFQKDNIIKSLI